MQSNEVYCGDALEILRTLPSESVNCCVTSPPYYGLRDYGIDGQIGLESSPEQYIERLADVFDEVKRVLKSDGTLWLNIGDSYAGNGKGVWNNKDAPRKHTHRSTSDDANAHMKREWEGIRPKNLIGIPWMLAFKLRKRGWYLRQDIIWHKPNPMPESVKDRCTKSHEYIFLLSKSDKYYFDAAAIAEPVTQSTVTRLGQDIKHQKGSVLPGKTNGNMKAAAPRYGGKKYTQNPDEFYRTKSGHAYDFRPYRNKRDVWTVSTKPYKGAHFATFPEELIEPCILAGCPKDGIVIDPFFGSGTVGVVCKRKQRNYIGIEINPKYIQMSEERTNGVQIEFV